MVRSAGYLGVSFIVGSYTLTGIGMCLRPSSALFLGVWSSFKLGAKPVYVFIMLDRGLCDFVC